MQENSEVELKLQVIDETVWDDLIHKLKTMPEASGYKKILLEANYFDTIDGSLHKARLAYRVRKENGQWIATIKGGGCVVNGLHKRMEWNIKVKNGEANLAVFNETTVDQNLIKQLGHELLIPIVQTDFVREVVVLTIGDDKIEVAMDRGVIIGNGNEVPILEIELELKAGKEKILRQFGEQLIKDFSLKLANKSKFLRGLELVQR
ncbi:MAG: domain containing protein [Firmicutes bacterium]|nr:domain containing protein [Bacillota bacterium]